MNINNSTIEKLAWWIVFLLLVLNIATFAKLTIDDNKKFHVLRANQNQLICIVHAFTVPHPQPLIDSCVKNNQ